MGSHFRVYCRKDLGRGDEYMNVGLAWEYFFLHLQDMGKSPHTLKNYRLDGKRWLSFLKEEEGFEQDLKEGGVLFQDCCLRYVEKVREGKESNRTKARRISSLRSFVRYVVLSGWYSVDFSEKLMHLPKEEPMLVGLTFRERHHLSTFYEMIARQQTE